MEIIQITNIVKNYQLGKITVEALKGVSLSLKEGDMICLMGPSGSGKTTLLNIIGAIDMADKGNVTLFGRDVSVLSDDELAEFRNRYMGFIFQSFNLIPVLTTFENVEYPLVLQRIPKNERKKRVLSILDNVGLKECVYKKPSELSGGQRQRVAIARVLVTKPRLIIADEPTANLDHKTGTHILEIMAEMNRRMKTTFIFSTHDPLVSKYADYIVHIMDGKIGESKDVS